MEMICSNCKRWYYSKYTEETYGMGVGRCTGDGSIQFCSHKCPFAVLKDEEMVGERE